MFRARSGKGSKLKIIPKKKKKKKVSFQQDLFLDLACHHSHTGLESVRVCTGTEGGEEEQLGQGGQCTAGSREAACLYDVSLRR